MGFLERREATKSEIKEAILKDPSKDPCVIIEGGLVQTGEKHLEYALALTELVKEGIVTGSPKDGWKIKTPPHSVNSAQGLLELLRPEPNSIDVAKAEEEITSAEEALLQIVSNPTFYSTETPAEQILDGMQIVNSESVTNGLVNLLADNILTLNENGSYSFLYTTSENQPNISSAD